MKKSNWMTLFCVVALVGVAGCSDDDDPITPDLPDVGPAAAAEAALNDALTEIVDPLFDVIEFFEDAIAVPVPASRGLVGCPDLTGVCSSGTMTCVEGETDLTFTATDCTTTATGDLLDGEVIVVPGLGTISMTFTGFSINGSTAIGGTVVLDEAECSALIDITAADGTILDGLVVDCDDNDPDDVSEFIIILTVQDVGVFVITFDFDNTGIASAFVTLDETPVAACTVDLDLLDATCTDL